jgi:hypothetical protein
VGRYRIVQPIGTVADEYVRLLLSGGWTAEQLRREARERRARGADRLADRLEYEAASLEKGAA